MTTVSAIDEPITPHQTLMGGVGALLTAGVLAVAAGAYGIVAGITLLILWAVTPGVYSVAVAYLLLVVAVPDPTTLHLFGVGAGTLVILLGTTSDVTVQIATGTVLGVSLLWASVFTVHQWLESMWLTAVFLLTLITLVGYGLHRYELVRLDLVEATE